MSKLSVMPAVACAFVPPFIVSARKMSKLSVMPAVACAFVPAPLMPEVAFVELPPQSADLSSRIVLPPHSTTWLAADMPPRPPPTTITCFAGKIVAMAAMGVGAHTRENPEQFEGREALNQNLSQ